MNTHDHQRRDGRAWGRGTEMKTLKARVTEVDEYKILIEGHGYVQANSFTYEVPLNREIFINLAKNGKSWLFVDWVEI